MTKSALINAKEKAEILGTSKSHAYKMVQKLNDELDKQGYIVIAGKVSRASLKPSCGRSNHRSTASITV